VDIVAYLQWRHDALTAQSDDAVDFDEDGMGDFDTGG